MRALLLGIGLVVSTASGLLAQTLIDRVVAVVDKEIITESDLQERLRMIAFQNQLDPTKPELRKQVLESMIAEKLILAQAIIDSVVVSPEEVTRTLDQQFANLVRQAGSQEKLEQYYGKPLALLKREYRDEMRKQLLVSRVRQTREANIHVAQREVEEFFEAYKDSLPRVPEELELSHIFITPKADSAHELRTRQRLEAILDSIRAGGDFADFAKRYGQDGTASQGGDLGWAKRGTFVPAFEEVVFSLKENEISNGFKTQFGYHIVQLLERRGESVHARHILLRTEKGAEADSAVVEQLRQWRQRAMKGESFADLARKYSEDEENKALGGDLGQVNADQLEGDFATVVKDLKEGEMSEPHRVPLGNSYGYQIVLLRKRIPAHEMNMKDDFKRIEQLALYVKKNRLYTEWVDELKSKIYWEIRSL